MSLAEILIRTQFPSFVDFAFRELNPGATLEENWHIEVMAQYLQAVYRAKSPDLNRTIFNLPPGSLKTHVCVIAFSCWMLGRNPKLSILLISETQELTMQLRQQCEELLRSPRYQAIFNRTRIKSSSRDLVLTYGGGIKHAGLGYNSLHKKSDVVIIDNPQSVQALGRGTVGSVSELRRLLKDPKGMIILATRRMADTDLSHRLLQSNTGWLCISMPAVAVSEEVWEMPSGRTYVRKKGEMLQERRDQWEELSDSLDELGEDNFCHQHLQGEYRPQAKGSLIITKEDGSKWEVVGNVSKDAIAREYLTALREEFKLGNPTDDNSSLST